MTAFHRTLEAGAKSGGNLHQRRMRDRAIRQRNVAARFKAGETVAEISAAMGYSEELVTEDLQDMGLMA